MPVKQKNVLTRDDLREALDAHQISISQVAKATGVSRPYISEFLSINRPLKPEQLQAIREYLEGEGVEFDEAARGADPAAQGLHPAVATVCHFPILAQRVPETRAVLEQMDRNDARIAELLNKEARRKSGFLEKGDYAGETVDDFSELFALLGANYMLFRYLTMEKNPLERLAGEQTLRSVLVDHLKESFDAAGLNTEPVEPAPAAEEEAA